MHSTSEAIKDLHVMRTLLEKNPMMEMVFLFRDICKQMKNTKKCAIVLLLN